MILVHFCYRITYCPNLEQSKPKFCHSPWSLSLIIWLLPLKGTLLSGKEPWSWGGEKTILHFTFMFIVFFLLHRFLKITYLNSDTFTMVCRKLKCLQSRQEHTVGVYTHWIMKNLLHQLSDDFGGRWQDGGFMLRFAGFQDGGEIYPAVSQVLTHAE